MEDLEKSDIIIDGFLNAFKPPFILSGVALAAHWLAYQQRFNDPKIDSNTIHLYIDLMLEEDLISVHMDNKGKYILTPFGRKVKREGGWIKYLEQSKIDKQQERDNIKASIETSELVRKNQAIQNRISRNTLIIASIAAIGTLGQWLTPLIKEACSKPIPSQTHQEFYYVPHKRGHCKYFYNKKCHCHIKTDPTTQKADKPNAAN